MTGADDTAVFPAYLVKGADPTVTADAVRELVARLVGGDDPALVVEELAGDDYEVGAVVDAAQTPPFFGGRRVVVARDIGRFRLDQAGRHTLTVKPIHKAGVAVMDLRSVILTPVK